MDHKKENHAALMGILAELAEGIKEKIDHGIETPMTRIEQYILLEAVLSFSQKVRNPTVLDAVLESDPVPMLLFCPRCRQQHIDKATETWTNPPHATHTCQTCGLLWRPSNFNTMGVDSIDVLELKHFERIQACFEVQQHGIVPAGITFSKAETQSGVDRVRRAENLLEQMLSFKCAGKHDGIETWLLNYGRGFASTQRRVDQGVEWDDRTQSAKTIRSGS